MIIKWADAQIVPIKQQSCLNLSEHARIALFTQGFRRRDKALGA